MIRSSTRMWAVFACACAALISPANAQPAPSPAPSASPSPAASASASPSASPSPSPTPYKLVTLGGSVDAGITNVGGTSKVRYVSGAPSHIFDGGIGPFYDENGGRELAPASDFNGYPDLQNANLQATLNGPVISAKFEGSFGTDADVIASNGQSRSGSNLTQAYLQAVKGPLTIIAGKFSTLAGVEVIEAPGNANYTRSFIFGDAIPFTHTGVRATYVVDPKVSIVAGVNDGWDDWKFAGKKKTIEGAILLTPSPATGLTVQTYNGGDFAVPGNSAIDALPVYTNRMLYDVDGHVNVTPAFVITGEYDNGTQVGDAYRSFSTAHWNGVMGYATYTLSPAFSTTFRKETFYDPQGFRTGFDQRLQSNTLTLDYTRGANYLFRLEYRLDASDLPVFTYDGITTDAPGRQHQNQIGFETVVKFP